MVNFNHVYRLNIGKEKKKINKIIALISWGAQRSVPDVTHFAAQRDLWWSHLYVFWMAHLKITRHSRVTLIPTTRTSWKPSRDPARNSTAGVYISLHQFTWRAVYATQPKAPDAKRHRRPVTQQHDFRLKSWFSILAAHVSLLLLIFLRLVYFKN